MWAFWTSYSKTPLQPPSEKLSQKILEHVSGNFFCPFSQKRSGTEVGWEALALILPFSFLPEVFTGGFRSESVQDNQVPALTDLARVKWQGMTLNFDVSCLNGVFPQSVATKAMRSSWPKCHLETVVKIPINLVCAAVATYLFKFTIIALKVQEGRSGGDEL